MNIKHETIKETRCIFGNEKVVYTDYWNYKLLGSVLAVKEDSNELNVPIANFVLLRSAFDSRCNHLIKGKIHDEITLTLFIRTTENSK